MFVGAGSCNVAIELGLMGYSTSNADSCASGAIAIGNAWNAVRRGDAEVMLAGGSEAPLAPLCFGAFTLIRAMSTRNEDPARACRPFDRDRDGFVMGEGAAVLVLEEREHALSRNAPIYAEIAGFACNNDAHHMTAPRPDAAGATHCIRRALEIAGVSPLQVDFVSAHGSSTPLNDVMETRALKQAFGEEIARRVPVSGTKALHAHALGATGAMEAAICCLAMRHHWIPPTLNLENPDPDCDLDYVPNVGRAAEIDVALSNSFGFGGINASLVFRRAIGGQA
jgi:3-oxoacyl-[acyl-carrier-protein] synthase II